jgi:hypothetical protein
VATALAVFKKESNRHCIKLRYNRWPQYKRENLGTVLTFIEPSDYIYSVGRCIVWWATQGWYRAVATVNTNMSEAVTGSHCMSITLRYLATRNNFKDPKFITVTSQSTGIAVLDRQTIAERYCPARHTVPPQHGHSGTDRPSTECHLPLPLCHPNTVTAVRTDRLQNATCLYPLFTSSHTNVFLFSQTVRKKPLWRRVPSNRSITEQSLQQHHSFTNPLSFPTQYIPPSAAVPVASLPVTPCTCQPLPLSSCSCSQLSLY